MQNKIINNNNNKVKFSQRVNPQWLTRKIV